MSIESKNDVVFFLPPPPQTLQFGTRSQNDHTLNILKQIGHIDVNVAWLKCSSSRVHISNVRFTAATQRLGGTVCYMDDAQHSSVKE